MKENGEILQEMPKRRSIMEKTQKDEKAEVEKEEINYEEDTEV